LIFEYDLPKVILGKIGPQDRRKKEFGIRDLPKQKITKPAFIACSD
jgi:hypothetical protein